jgi:hypothetical protein
VALYVRNDRNRLDDTILNYEGHAANIEFIADMFQNFMGLVPQNLLVSENSIRVLGAAYSLPSVSSLRLESGLVYTIISHRNILSGLKILVMADKSSEPLVINMILHCGWSNRSEVKSHYF